MKFLKSFIFAVAALASAQVYAACSTTQTSDTTFVMNRVCSGTVVRPSSGQSFAAQFDQYTAVWGAWPVQVSSNGAVYKIATVAQNQFVSFAFVPNTSGNISISGGMSYGGGTISVSSEPGGFIKGSSYGTVCVAAHETSSNMTIGALAGAGCQVIAGQTYYLNLSWIAEDGSKSSCFAKACNLAFVVTQFR